MSPLYRYAMENTRAIGRKSNSPTALTGPSTRQGRRDQNHPPWRRKSLHGHRKPRQGILQGGPGKKIPLRRVSSLLAGPSKPNNQARKSTYSPPRCPDAPRTSVILLRIPDTLPGQKGVRLRILISGVFALGSWMGCCRWKGSRRWSDCCGWSRG